ncbi:MAG: undecaprenyldiphospho-muramoylpentapeptide beta-N-acetylglucosaminyltransferase [Gemmatimonadetes bacterium]|nr:undecaprenyldiphospho-muramoylpentapeptide beta-N-acetylglucosaminyltransferase [Gemmatimonadota bacterium]
MKVIIAGGGTGGHLMPALALADALVAVRADVEVVLVGAQRGVEAQILPKRRYRYQLLPSEPIYRRQWWKNYRWPLLAWRLLSQCRALLDAERPAFVVGTGGYAAGPMLYGAWRRGVPIALQEQNALPGITTRWLARAARQVHLGFPEVARSLRVGRQTAVYTFGNPITPPLPTDRAVARSRLGIRADARVVLVMGGSQGARAVNQAVAGMLDANLLSDVCLLWSTGPAWFEANRKYHHPPERLVRPFWDPVAEAYAAADLVVARAGAMTTAELCAWGLPSVLVPLPTAAADHQTANAKALDAAGVALYLPESQLTPESLARRIHELLTDPDRRNRMSAAARARGQPDAAKRIAEALLQGML